jgi:predicted 3-demethylubiquinone-9 3-methyltransferase (glyoxalase superfamily)
VAWCSAEGLGISNDGFLVVVVLMLQAYHARPHRNRKNRAAKPRTAWRCSRQENAAPRRVTWFHTRCFASTFFHVAIGPGLSCAMAALTQKVTPFLWFDADAEEAVKFYTSVFPNSRILSTSRYPEGSRGPAGTVMTIDFELAGQRLTALNGGPHFKFNEAISFVVSCDTQAEIDAYWDRLTSNGGRAVQCGWLTDRFGLSWQIVPSILMELVKDPAKGPRVMAALMKMMKLDIAGLKAAAEGR